MDDAVSRKEAPLKKKAHAKAAKPTKPKKVAATRNEMGNDSVSRGRNVTKSLDVVINGIVWDISGIPTSVFSCTAIPSSAILPAF